MDAEGNALPRHNRSDQLPPHVWRSAHASRPWASGAPSASPPSPCRHGSPAGNSPPATSAPPHPGTTRSRTRAWPSRGASRPSSPRPSCPSASSSYAAASANEPSSSTPPSTQASCSPSGTWGPYIPGWHGPDTGGQQIYESLAGGSGLACPIVMVWYWLQHKIYQQIARPPHWSKWRLFLTDTVRRILVPTPPASPAVRARRRMASGRPRQGRRRRSSTPGRRRRAC